MVTSVETSGFSNPTHDWVVVLSHVVLSIVWQILTAGTQYLMYVAACLEMTYRSETKRVISATDQAYTWEGIAGHWK